MNTETISTKDQRWSLSHWVKIIPPTFDGVPAPERKTFRSQIRRVINRLDPTARRRIDDSSEVNAAKFALVAAKLEFAVLVTQHRETPRKDRPHTRQLLNLAKLKIKQAAEDLAVEKWRAASAGQAT